MNSLKTFMCLGLINNIVNLLLRLERLMSGFDICSSIYTPVTLNVLSAHCWGNNKRNHCKITWPDNGRTKVSENYNAIVNSQPKTRACYMSQGWFEFFSSSFVLYGRNIDVLLEGWDHKTVQTIICQRRVYTKKMHRSIEKG